MVENKDLLEIGQIFAGQYRVLDVVGTGGAGAVFRARQESVGRDVALKILALHLAQKGVMVERFRREAHSISQLKHPNTVTLFDYGFADGFYFIAMELLEGRTLGSMIRSGGALPPSRAFRILEQTLRALSEAHDNGIVHRDLKPDNIFVANIHGEIDFVKVLDFGIAKAISSKEEQLTVHGTVFGTPSYMSPEQAMGHEVLPATDVYAAGLILWEMLAGKMAVQGDTVYSVLSRQVNDPTPKLPRKLRDHPLAAVITRATLKDPTDRFRDAGDFLAKLRLTAADLPGIGAMQGGGGYGAPQPTMMVAPAETEGHEEPKTLMVDASEPSELGAAVPTYLEGLDSQHGAAKVPRVAELPRPFPSEDLRAPNTGELPWLDRTAELDKLLDMTNAVGNSTGTRLRYAVLEGEPGIGKSRLIRQYAQVATEESSVTVHLVGATRSEALGAFRDLLLKLTSRDHDPDGQTEQELHRIIYQQIGPGSSLFKFLTAFVTASETTPDVSPLDSGSMEALFAIIALIMTESSRLQPFVVCIDDIHRADKFTIALLEFLLSNPSFEEAAVGLVAVADRGPLEATDAICEGLLELGWKCDDRFVHLRLESFDEGFTGILTGFIFSADRELRRALYELTGGSPDLLMRTVEHNLEIDRLTQRFGRWSLDGRSLAVPPKIERNLRRKLDKLFPTSSAENRSIIATLQWSAILGDSVTKGLLRDVLTHDRRFLGEHFDASWSAVVGRGLLRRTADRRFHRVASKPLAGVLTSDIEEAIGVVQVHTIAFEALRCTEMDAPSTKTARHLTASDRHTAAAEMMTAVGDKAKSDGRMDDARAAYLEADDALGKTGLASDDTQRVQLAVSLAEVELNLGYHALAVERATLAEMRVSPRREALRIRLELVLARVLRVRFDPTRASELLTKALLRIEDKPSTQLAEAITELGLASHDLGNSTEFRRCTERLDRLKGSNDPGVAATAGFGTGLMWVLASQLDSASRALHDALSVLDDSDNLVLRVRLHNLLGRVVLANGGDPTDMVTRALRLAEDHGLLEAIVDSLATLARCDADRGETRQASGRLRRAWTILEQQDMVSMVPDVLVAVAEVRAGDGDGDGARAMLRRATQLLDKFKVQRADGIWAQNLIRARERIADPPRQSARERAVKVPNPADPSSPPRPNHSIQPAVEQGPDQAPAQPDPPAAPKDPDPCPDTLEGSEERKVAFQSYEAPIVLAFPESDHEVREYRLYLGPEMPTFEDAAHLWDGELLQRSGLIGYTLPGEARAFEDLVSPQGARVFMAAFALLADGSLVQPPLGVPSTPPSDRVLLK